jgi:hypothetical protein
MWRHITLIHGTFRSVLFLSVNGKYHGYGRCQYQDGSIYIGEWKSGAVSGRGTLMTQDGHVLHDGNWLNDRPVLPTTKKVMDEGV